MSTKILVVEDDNIVRNLISTTLEAYGYKYDTAENGQSAIKLAALLQPDIFILDLGLPDIDGIEVIRRIRSWTRNPIIVVSARNEISDKIEALDMGADDYLTKPFSVEELLARIRVAERKLSYDSTAAAKESSVFENGNLKIDYASSCVYVDGQEVHLTPTEYDLLCLLAKNVGKILTRNYIINEVWKSNVDTDYQSLRVFMAVLRKKIEKNPSQPRQIQTHVGIGYRMIRISADGEEQGS